jgi:plasmid rolling circle replication initiator protein Rep
MRRIERRKKKTTTLKLKPFKILLTLSILSLLLFFILNYRTQTKVNETFKYQTNETSSTTIIASSQENISDTPTTNTSEVVIIRKAGRIQIVS